MTATQDAPTTAVLHSRFPGSRKAYVAGPRSDMRIPTREVALTPSEGRFGDGGNAAVRLYDTSGPFCSMRISQDVREYAKAHGVAEEEAIPLGMAEKAAEFRQQGATIYRAP